MVKVIVFHYTDNGRLPKLNKNELNEVMKNIYNELKNYPDVKYNGTYVDNEGKGICDWDAPNAEVVNEILNKVLGGPPVDGAIEVKRVL